MPKFRPAGSDPDAMPPANTWPIASDNAPSWVPSDPTCFPAPISCCGSTSIRTRSARPHLSVLVDGVGVILVCALGDLAQLFQGRLHLLGTVVPLPLRLLLGIRSGSRP